MSLIELVSVSSEEVFRIMGSGHSEVVYEAALDVEITLRSAVRHRRQVPCMLTYKERPVGTGFIDMLVGESLIVEIKAIAKLTNKDEQQVRKYLEATGLEQALLINFGNDLQIERIQKGNYEQTPSAAD